MEKKKKKQTVEKKRKKIVAFNLSEDVIDDFNNKINYNLRSKTVDNLISDFVNKKKNLPLITRQIPTKKTSSFKKRGFTNV